MQTFSGVEDLTKRFRPNLVVHGVECPAFSEDNWKSINIGSNEFQVSLKYFDISS